MINKIYEEIKKYIKENYVFIIILVFTTIFCFYDTGYSIYKPGGTINETERITGDVYKSKGTFNMAYVGMIDGRLPYYLLAKIIPSWELVKNDKITYNDKETMEDTLERDRLYYEEAISNAKLVAYTKANVKFNIDSTKYYVMYVTTKNNSNLKIGDQILSYDNITFTGIDEFIKYINSKKASDEIKIKYLRDNKEENTNAKIYQEKNKLYIGLSVVKITNISSNTKINIMEKESESGPSGGLIMTLSIYNALTKKDITYGKKIVGTGTIAEDGIVGEIGSVTYKLSSAVHDKADIFICPKANYKEAIKYAKKHKYDIIIKGVSSFDEALNILNNMEEK
jgi:Lon-like protease